MFSWRMVLRSTPTSQYLYPIFYHPKTLVWSWYSLPTGRTYGRCALIPSTPCSRGLMLSTPVWDTSKPANGTTTAMKLRLSSVPIQPLKIPKRVTTVKWRLSTWLSLRGNTCTHNTQQTIACQQAWHDFCSDRKIQRPWNDKSCRVLEG